jgi:predicted PolB exonuclease-like 3'-5' exonuclease
MTHYVVFDLETSPDLDMARRLLGLGPEVVDDAVREAIGKRYSRDGQAPIDVFLKPPLHQILCIGALFAERQGDGAYIVRRLGARHIGDKGEADLVRDFVAALPRDDAGNGPVLASFNGGSFDLPILRYREVCARPRRNRRRGSRYIRGQLGRSDRAASRTLAAARGDTTG